MQTGTMETILPKVATANTAQPSMISALEQFSSAVQQHVTGEVKSMLAVGVDGAIVAAGLSKNTGAADVQIASGMGEADPVLEAVRQQAGKTAQLIDLNTNGANPVSDLVLSPFLIESASLDRLESLIHTIASRLSTEGSWFASFRDNSGGDGSGVAVDAAGTEMRTYRNRAPYHRNLTLLRTLAREAGLRIDYLGEYGDNAYRKLIVFRQAKAATVEAKESTGVATGERHYRAFVGPEQKYDLAAAMQFNVLTGLGLREHHKLLDVGCGSLRGGRLFMAYLKPGNYFGIEPEKWLIEEGIHHEVGEDMVRIKRPRFSNDANFTFSEFGASFNYMLAQSIFSHASQQQIRRAMDEAARTLAPGGIFAFTFHQGDSDYEGDEWVYPGCCHYKVETIRQHVERVGLLFDTLEVKHPNSQKWAVAVRPNR